MKVCRNIFRTCAVLHNMMLTDMLTDSQASSRLRQEEHLASDGSMWLEGPSNAPQPIVVANGMRRHKAEFDHRCILLAHHLRVWRGKINETPK